MARNFRQTLWPLSLVAHVVQQPNIYRYNICGCTWENQAYWSCLRKWGFNRTDKSYMKTAAQNSENRLHYKSQTWFNLSFDKFDLSKKIKKDHLYMGIVQNCKLRLGLVFSCAVTLYIPLLFSCIGDSCNWCVEDYEQWMLRFSIDLKRRQ